MQRRLLYLAVLLIVLGGILGPAFYTKKVYSSRHQGVAGSVTVAEKGQLGGGLSPKETLPEGDASGSAPAIQEPAAKDAGAAAGAGGKQATPKTGGASEGGSREAAAPQQTTLQDEGIPVWVAVVGKNGELLFPPSQVRVRRESRWGLTALGALEATGLPYTTKPTWPDFVESIAGQANYQMSGWMYAVNGEVPMHMASKHPVKAGDRVIWWYSTSMDKPVPRWEDLARGR
ncbi:DUF4430 domain-containing protein [Desulfovirgula thermocuniculi]|uniref:DUF4430 domain-containing protein n=1 Tax=Desulfovirgula thermocuniculi TaxID=348842 RepID=UPI0003F90C54|nr:DUF4430 domain-containing protein [Desulfovirgula thermocuniculi]